MPATGYNAAVGYNEPISYNGDILINVSFTESMEAGDSLANTATLNVGFSESASPGDALASTATFNAAFAEGLAATDSLTNTATLNVSFTETAELTDSLDALVLAATPDSRIYTVGGTASPMFIKDPDSRLDYCIAWGEWLGSDTIATSVWLLPSGLTAYATANTPSSATLWIEGGALGGEYKATNRIVTVAGRVEDRTLTFKIRNK